jgi:hypothetical protein
LKCVRQRRYRSSAAIARRTKAIGIIAAITTRHRDDVFIVPPNWLFASDLSKRYGQKSFNLVASRAQERRWLLKR